MNFVKFLLSQHFFDIFILNILSCCSGLYKIYYFLKLIIFFEYDEVFQMDINKSL